MVMTFALITFLCVTAICISLGMIVSEFKRNSEERKLNRALRNYAALAQ